MTAAPPGAARASLEPPGPRPRRPAAAPPRPRRRGSARWLVLACLALAALAHLLPAAPTYDPWAWLIWGRELTGLELHTRTGPSWKPLPVLFTVPFALTGDDWAPELWLVVAQGGGLLALAFTYRLAARLMVHAAGSSAHSGGPGPPLPAPGALNGPPVRHRAPCTGSDDPDSAGDARNLRTRTLAGRAAGVIAVASLLLADEFVRHFARGNSEGLLVALCLWAVERHLDGHRTQAFLLGVAAGLLRPELWPFLLAYGLWLGWREPRRRALVVGCGALTLALWLLPEWWGSGDPFRAAARARDPNPDSAAFAEHPFLETFRRAELVLAFPVLLGAAIALGGAVLRRDPLRLTLAAIAAVLMLAVAGMTEAGFAGNLRYVALPAALVCVLAGAGWTELVGALRRRAGPLVAAAAAAALLVAAWPSLDAARIELREDLDVVRAEAELYDDLADIVARAGGPAAVLACRPVHTLAFEQQAVAWALRVRSEDVSIVPSPPGTALAAHDAALAHDPRFAPLLENRRWRLARNCGGPTP
jgi:hypothetical protein